MNHRPALVLVTLALALALGLAPVRSDDSSDRTSYQGVTLEPGDVLDFHGGVFTAGHALEYGHTALYLGREKETGEDVFLDFGPKVLELPPLGPKEHPERAYGRIMREREFLDYSAKNHPSFDVFRLKQRSGLDPDRLVKAAYKIAVGREYSLLRAVSPSFGEECASAAGAVLADVTGLDIKAIAPDYYAKSSLFQRHPALPPDQSIDIRQALKEAAARDVRPLFRAQQELDASQRTDLEKLRADLVKAQSILGRARAGQQASDPRIADENRQAALIAECAVADDTRAIELAQTTIKRWAGVGQALARMKAASGVPAAGITSIRGNVTVKRTDGKERVSLGEEVLMPGDEVQTNQGGVEIVARDGSILHFGPGSTFKVPLFPPPPSPDVSTSYPPWELLKGILHLDRDRAVEKALGATHSGISTPAAVLAVRGTEFDLSVEDSGLTRCTPYSGTLEATANPDGMEPAKLRRWWEIEGADPVKGPLPEGALVRVLAAEGEVRLRTGSEGQPRAVSNGDLLESGAALATGPGSLAQVQLAGGLLVTLSAGAVLEAKLKSGSAQPLYKLSAGAVHVMPAAQAASGKAPIFVTPNAVIAGEGAEFDLSVDEAGVATVTPYSGKVTASAQIDRLDQTKLDRWWDGIYR